jgi:predicted DNA-binding protein (UPF0251 family)
MPRPLKPRWVDFEPPRTGFVPKVMPFGSAVQVLLTLDELESLRLADMIGLSHEEAAAEMKVSRATFGRIVERARKKTADALVNAKCIGFEGGEVRFHPPRGPGRRGGPKGAGGHHGHGRSPRHRMTDGRW